MTDQRIQFAPLPMFGQREVHELNDVGLGMSFESWQELYGFQFQSIGRVRPTRKDKKDEVTCRGEIC